jgi:hypothetical protein
MSFSRSSTDQNQHGIARPSRPSRETYFATGIIFGTVIGGVFTRLYMQRAETNAAQTAARDKNRAMRTLANGQVVPENADLTHGYFGTGDKPLYLD